VQALDARGVHVPVVIGGAAINRAFGHRSGVLPDGRLYEPGVFYCRDVFEGIDTLNALMDVDRRPALVERIRSEIDAARHDARDVVRTPPPARPAAPPTSVAAPVPPYWGARRVSADLRDVWQHLDRNTLF